jgi:hypothetical protein
MHGASGGQVLGKRAPLATGAQDIHHAVRHLAHLDAPFAAARLCRRDQRFDMRPFLVGQIARIAQFVAVVAGTVFGSPHPAPHKINRRPQGITNDPALSSGRSAPPANQFTRHTKSPDGH